MRGSSEREAAGRCRIHPFSVPDMESVLRIEEDSFSFPWSREMFLSELGREGVSRCFVAEVADAAPAGNTGRNTPGSRAVAGYIMSLLVADELHITNLAVSPACRRLGIAARLVGHALDNARAAGAVWCQLEVRSTNIAAQGLYRKFGFREIGVRRGYYRDGEDALVLALDLSP